MAFSTLEKLLAAAVGIDLLAPGTTRKAVESALARVVPAATPSAVTAAPRPIGFFPPAAAVAGATVTGLAAAEQAQRDMAASQFYQIPIPTGINPLLMDMPTVEIPVRRKTTRKRLSNFNKSVKAGMKAVRNSTSYGKKGTINNAKKAFSAVTKVASKVNRGKKVSNKGVTGTIARAVRKIL